MVKKKVTKKGVFALIIMSSILFAALIASNSFFASASSSIKCISPKNKTVSLLNSKVKAWHKKGKTGNTNKYYKKGEQSYPKKVKLTWKTVGSAKGSFTLLISENKKMRSAKKYTTGKKYYHLTNLKTGTRYYWKVRGRSNGRAVESKTCSFKTAATPRLLKVAKVSNFRDAGGYKTISGKKVRQGMIYRCAKLDNINKSGRKTVLKQLGVRTDLDLRKPGEGTAGKRSPLGSSVRYYNISGVMYDGVWENSKSKKTLVREMKVFANKNNYPIAFHCTYGRDRTGTLAFTLNALLGLKKKDLYKEYELSFFSKMGNHGKLSPKERTKLFTKLYKYMKGYGKKGTSLSKCTEKFLRDNGMKKAEIKRIKQILLH